MSLKKPNSNFTEGNGSNPKNFSHLSNLPTNFNLKSISLEDCDQGVFLELNERFKIGENLMPVILLDAELTSLREMNIKQYDKDKQFLNLPLFTMIRKEAKPKYRTNPSNKQIIYIEPKQTDNGVVICEYIYNGPLCYDLIYEFKFITNFREHSNKLEEQLRHHFRNKRTYIVVNEERFTFGPNDFSSMSSIEVLNSNNPSNNTLYVSTYTFKLDCFIRDLSTMQKRERPNKFTLSMNVENENGKNCGVSTVQEINITGHLKEKDCNI